MSEKQPAPDIQPRRQKEVIYRLGLEDRGQGLTTLHVMDGVIVYSGLIQRLTWEGRSLTAKEFTVGEPVIYVDAGGVIQTLDYPIISVERIEHAVTYREWLAAVDQLAWTQWAERDYTANAGANRPGDSWIEYYLEGVSPTEAWEEEVHAAAA